VPMALKAVKKGGRVVCAGIHMSDIPSFPYARLWEERQLLSVANLTRQDGEDFLALAPRVGIKTQVTRYALKDANRALADLKAGAFEGAAVLIPWLSPDVYAGCMKAHSDHSILLCTKSKSGAQFILPIAGGHARARCFSGNQVGREGVAGT
jgi:hypothetical protein